MIDKTTLSKKLLASFLACATLTLCGCGKSIEQAVDTGSDTSLQISNVRQLVAKDNKTARTIMWRAEAKQGYKVEYRAKDVANKAVEAQDVSFKGGDTEYTQYKAELTGLKPGTTYEYRVVAGNNKGSWHKLNTDDGKGFTALVFADSQSSGTYKEWKAVTKLAREKHPESKLYLNLGDLVDCGEHGYQWSMWFEGIEPFSADMPMASAIGNHECYSLKYQEIFPKTYLNLFHLPANGNDKYKNQFYSFDYGDVHFTVIDTNAGWEVAPYQPNLVQDMIRWMDQDLASSKAKWKVVLMHRDIFLYRFGPNSGRPQTFNTYFFAPSWDYMTVFDKHKVDAVLSGHLHAYRRRVPLKNHAPADKGTMYIMTGVSGNQSYGELWDNYEWDAKRSIENPEVGNFMTMTAEADSLTFKAYTQKGQEFDSITLKK